jgi:serine/threonine-protein kinase
MENGIPNRPVEPAGADAAAPKPGILSREIPVLPDGATPMPLGSGTTVSVLGEGGAAIVYEIWVEKLGISRAVKVLKPNASIESTDRFQTEMRITAQLRHPNIIEIHNVGEWHGLPYIEMEKIDGFSLDAVLRERGCLPLRICTAIAIITCRALTFTHNHVYLVDDKEHRGILHRDLKPGNIMISRSGVVKLMDFGIATPTGISMHTMEGTVVGSMQYIAPELLEGTKGADARSDIFSLGCLLYEMITGHRTFPEKNMAKLVTARMKNSYKPLREFRVKCPRSLVKLVNACLAFNPDKRISSVAEVLRRLEKIHARLSYNKPEDLVEYYINSSLQKNTVLFRGPAPCSRVVAAGAVAAIAACVCLYAVPYLPYRIIRSFEKIGAVINLGVHGAGIGSAMHSRLSARSGFRQESRFGSDLSLPTRKLPAMENTTSAGGQRNPATAGSILPELDGRAHLASLKKKYGTHDLLEILGRETDKSHFVAALQLFDALDKESAATVRARLYKLRAMQGLGNKEALDAFFLRPDIPDKEYYLAKAQYFTSLKRFIEAIDMCEKSRQSPASIGGSDSLDRISSYIKASCLTSLFIASSTDEARKRAIDSWNDLLAQLRDNQDHPFYALAEKNIHLLADQTNSAKP